MLDNLMPAIFGIFGVAVAGLINYRITRENRKDKEIDFSRKRLEEIYELSMKIIKMNEDTLTKIKSSMQNADSYNIFQNQLFRDTSEKKIRLAESRLVMLIQFYHPSANALSEEIDRISHNNLITRIRLLLDFGPDGVSNVNQSHILTELEENQKKLTNDIMELQSDLKNYFQKKLGYSKNRV